MIAHFNNTQKGIVYALVGYTAFAFNDINAKWLVQQLPATQVACLQALFGAILFLCLNQFIGGWRGFDCKKERKIHILRGVVNAALSIVLIYAFQFLSLANIYAMIFTVPFFAVIFSQLFYAERADLRSWASIIVGFCGVLLVLQPGAGMDLLLLLPLLGALGVALNVVVSKSLQKASPFLIGFYPLTITCLILLPFMISDFIVPSPRQFLHFCLSGVLVSTAITMTSMAFRIAPSHKVSPFVYTEMIWGLLFGYLIFADVPDMVMLAGALIIILSGLYVILHAHREGRKLQKSGTLGV